MDQKKCVKLENNKKPEESKAKQSKKPKSKAASKESPVTFSVLNSL
jgi:hypothetical protein